MRTGHGSNLSGSRGAWFIGYVRAAAVDVSSRGRRLRVLAPSWTMTVYEGQDASGIGASSCWKWRKCDSGKHAPSHARLATRARDSRPARRSASQRGAAARSGWQTGDAPALLSRCQQTAAKAVLGSRVAVLVLRE